MQSMADDTLSFDVVPALAYVTAPEAPAYRAIVAAFARARRRYRIQLRPADVRALLEQGGYRGDVSDETLRARLTALADWGNLAASHDEAAVERLDEYYMRRMVYRLTTTGLAAHDAVKAVEGAAERSGALQATMLDKIVESLDRLDALACHERPDPDRAKSALDSLHAAFDSLTDEASRFIGELQAHLEQRELDPAVFEVRKQALITYLRSFVGRLGTLSDPIRRKVHALGPHHADLVAAAQRSGDLPPAVGDVSPAEIYAADQRQRWAGVVEWFDPIDGESTERVLQRVAEQSVSRLVHALHRLRDRVTRRIDRAADFRQLARWFVDCPTDDDAHRLFGQAFGLHPARHFHLAEEDAELTAPRTSWWDADPVAVPVHLRRRGTRPTAGRTGKLVDLSQSRDWLRAARENEHRAQRAAAAALAAASGRLSAIDHLERPAFDLLLRLLGAALAAPPDASGRRAGESEDGGLRLSWRALDGSPPVLLTTDDGRLRLPCDAEFDVEEVAR